MTTRDIEYSADGITMKGRLALPDGADKRPAVLIAHEGAGLTDNVRLRAERLAELGYVAFALDYHGGGRFISDRDELMGRFQELNGAPDRIRALGTAGLDVLLAEPRVDASKVVAIGYCFGGAMVLELAKTGADLKAVVGFHPSLNIRSDASKITGRVLVCVGSEDPFVPVEDRLAFEQEMRAAGVDWRLNLYGGAQHSFTQPPLADFVPPPGIQYHQLSDERSWRAMTDLFDEALA